LKIAKPRESRQQIISKLPEKITFFLDQINIAGDSPG